jgi:hypothetical protein
MGRGRVGYRPAPDRQRNSGVDCSRGRGEAVLGRYDRIVRALADLGHEASDQTVVNVLRRHDVPPTPERKRTACRVQKRGMSRSKLIDVVQPAAHRFRSNLSASFLGQRHRRSAWSSPSGQAVVPSSDTTAMLLWALLARRQIIMRKVDAWQTLATQPSTDRTLDLAA